MLPIKTGIFVLVVALFFGAVRIEHGHDPHGGQRWVKFSVNERTVAAAHALLARLLAATDDWLAAGPPAASPPHRGGPSAAAPPASVHSSAEIRLR